MSKTPRCPSGHRNPFGTPCQAPHTGRDGTTATSGGKNSGGKSGK